MSSNAARGHGVFHLTSTFGFPSLLISLQKSEGGRMCLPPGVASSPDLPRTSVFLGSRELGSPSDERGALPPAFPVVLMVGALLDSVDVLSGSQSEDEEVTGLHEPLQVAHEAPRMLRGPLLGECSFELVESWDTLRKGSC